MPPSITMSLFTLDASINQLYDTGISPLLFALLEGEKYRFSKIYCLNQRLITFCLKNVYGNNLFPRALYDMKVQKSAIVCY